MKHLILIRHAKSSWSDSNLKDAERPLKGRGKRDALIMGNVLRKANIKPDLIISSPANRAHSTAKIIADEIGYNKKDIQINDDLYFAGEEDILEVVKKADDNHNIIFIFGHNPDFTGLANKFTSDYISNVPTCGVVAIDFNVDSWEKLTFENGKIKAKHFPKSYR